MTDTRARAVQPNFAARRMLVSAAAITAIVVAVATVWQAFDGDDDRAESAPATWDAVAFVATANGDVTLVDPGGTVVARHAGDARVTGLHAAGTHLAVVHADRVVALDVATGADLAATEFELDAPARVVTRLATTRDRLLLAAGSRNGGAIRTVDADAGAAYDLAELAGLSAPRLFTGTLRADPLGSTVAVADAASFQTIVVSGLDDAEQEPVVENYAAQPLAVGQGLLATTQVVGGRADVSVHRLGTTPSAPVSMGIPAGGMIVDGRLLAVTTDGAVVAIRVGDRQPRQLARLALPPDAVVTAVHPAASGERLVVYAGAYVAVLDPDGEVLFELDASAAAASPPSSAATTATSTETTASPTSGQVSGQVSGTLTADTSASRPPVSEPDATVPTSAPTTAPSTTPATTPAADTPIEPAEPLVPAWEWNCLAVGLGTREAALISLDDGRQLTELAGLAVTGTSAGDVTEVAGEAGRSELGETRAAMLSPDGRLVVRRTVDRATALVPLDDELQPGTPIDVTDLVPAAAYAVTFVER